MNLIAVFHRFPDHVSCLEHLEKVRWHHSTKCPFCTSEKVARKVDGFRIGRWNCHSCHSSFNVLSGTIFEKTKIDLQKWFLAISLILHAKKSISSHQLARDLDLNQKTAWYMGMRIRRNMTADNSLLAGIVEADEAYIGGKPRKFNRRDVDQPKHRRGRGTDKLPIVGAVERGGKVVAEPSPDVTSRTLGKFLWKHLDKGSLLITDEYPGYKGMNIQVRHATIDHSKQYANGLIHTNTIEGFWGLLKRAWYGSHHHYTRKHAKSYIVEACYKYNTRRFENPFASFLQTAVAV